MKKRKKTPKKTTARERALRRHRYWTRRWVRALGDIYEIIARVKMSVARDRERELARRDSAALRAPGSRGAQDAAP